jgi:hypothetical protein
MLKAAYHKENIRMINLLLENSNINRRYNNHIIMRKAIDYKKTDVINVLLYNTKTPATPLYDRNKLLIMTSGGIGRYNVDVINIFLKAGADCSTQNYESIKEAARIGNQHTVKLLMQYKEHHSEILRDVLIMGIKKNEPKVVKLLLKYQTW